MASRKNSRGDGADTAADKELEALFAAPLEDFTAAKKDAAKRLRAAGQEDAADEVLALQKPNLPAWVVNQLARAYPDDMRALLESGERLKQAQQQALQGEGADALREGTRAQRGLVLVLTEDAGELLRRAGKAANPATLDQVQATLTAGANGTDEERALLEKGRLVRPLERVSFGGLVDVRAPPQQPKAKAPEDKRAKEAERDHKAAEKRAKEAEREHKEAEKRAEAARKEADKRVSQRTERERAAEQQRAAKEAEQRAKEAEGERKEAEKRAKEAERERAAAEQRA
ncbi:MAG TPA: hypothetical protein VK447_01565, partial [Myxococcaceae bacterium]|nr:hypothetical protein [Myxococcaceae bacterium]